MGGRRSPWLLVAVLLASVLGGCDGSTSRGRRPIAGGRLIVYSSLPLLGPAAADGRAVLRGERIALAAAHGRVGRYHVVLRSLDDATRSSNGWNPGRTNTNATTAARDPRTIGYLGDLDSGASAVALPVLNRARIPQVSPLSTAVGLTHGGPEAQPGEPEKYYPALTRTFARLAPDDAVQAAVQVTVQRLAGCASVFVVSDQEFDGRDAADTYAVVARRAGLRLDGSTQYAAGERLGGLTARLSRLAPDCVLISAVDQDGAATLTDAIARAVPDAALFATAVSAEPALVARGGVDASAARRLTITLPTLGPSDYPPAGRRFERAFDARYGSGAGEGIWGDAAMSLLLHAIGRASDGGGRAITRRRVLHALLTTRALPSVLGTYSITRSGDSTLRRYGVYRVRHHRLSFVTAIRG